MKKTSILLLLGILALAFFFRFFRLESIPPGLYPDEAMNGVNALRALGGADFPVFYPDNNGREGLFINLQALMVQVFGVSAWTLRATSALIGALTVLVIFGLARELSLWVRERANEKEGLFRTLANPIFPFLAAFLLAVNSWHVHFSRIGFRAIMVSLILGLAVFLLMRGMRTRRLREYCASGFFWGLGFYTYIGFRLTPLLGVLLFFFDFIMWWRERKTRSFKRFAASYAAFGIAMFLTALPLLGYFAAHPEYLASRAAPISVFAAERPLVALAESAAKTLLMFNIYGDGNLRHNLPGAPQLTFLVGIAFLIGIARIIKDSFAAFKKRVFALELPNVMLGGWFFVMLLPAILTTEGMPHALRASGAIIPVILFAAVGFLTITEAFARMPRIGISSAFAILLMLVSANAINEFYRYFMVWAAHPEVPGAFRQDLTAISQFLNDRGNTYEKRYVIVNEDGVLLDGVPMPSATIRFLTQEDPSIEYLAKDGIDAIVPAFDRTLIVLTRPVDESLEAALQAQFPSLQKQDDPVLHYTL